MGPGAGGTTCSPAAHLQHQVEGGVLAERVEEHQGRQAAVHGQAAEVSVGGAGGEVGGDQRRGRVAKVPGMGKGRGQGGQDVPRHTEAGRGAACTGRSSVRVAGCLAGGRRLWQVPAAAVTTHEPLHKLLPAPLPHDSHQYPTAASVV